MANLTITDTTLMQVFESMGAHVTWQNIDTILVSAYGGTWKITRGFESEYTCHETTNGITQLQTLDDVLFLVSDLRLEIAREEERA